MSDRAALRSRPFRIVVSVAFVLVALFVTAVPAAAVSGVRWPVQSRGDRGTDVLAIQLLLRDPFGPATDAADAAALPPADGVFGLATDSAVRVGGRRGPPHPWCAGAPDVQEPD